jgi:predicted hotdog family 3-hydroxylacyl-ACP dehydratase
MLMENLRLPLPASELIPHRETMLLVESLLAFDQVSGAGTIAAGIKFDSTFTAASENGDGLQLEEVVLLEMMAQAYACLRGYEDRLAGRPPGLGFLVGVRHFSCCRPVAVDEEVVIEVATKIQIDTFFIADAVVKVALETVAEAELKIWLPPQEEI